MSKWAFLFILCWLMTIPVNGQSVQFERLSWRDALAKAKREHRMLFVEMYTPWCTYCRQMERSVFPAAEVGTFYNEHFINVRFDALTTDGKSIRNSYVLGGFPSLLYLDENGVVISKSAGYLGPEKMVKIAKDAFLRWKQQKSQAIQSSPKAIPAGQNQLSAD